MKRLIVLYTILLMFSPIFAQREINNGVVVDKQAEGIISKTSSKLKSESPISIDFSLSTKENRKSSSEKGSLTFNNNKYFASFIDNKVYCDGKSVWIYNKDTKEVNINNVDNSENDILNISKFVADANKNYRAKLIRQEKGNYVIDLLPKKKSDISKVRLLINKKSSRINEMSLSYKSGNTYIYKITSYKVKVKTIDTDFVFQKKNFPNATIVDLR